MPITIAQMEEIKPFVATVVDTLRMSGAPQLLFAQLTLNTTDPDDFASKLCSVEWWGGSGSIFDFAPSDVDVSRKLFAALWCLCDMMIASSLTCPPMIARFEILEEWRKSKVFSTA